MKHRKDANAERYINAIGPAARAAMLKTGIPASFLIADLALTSQFGQRRMHLPFSTLFAEDILESPFGGRHNRWSFLLEQARGLRSYYGLTGKHKPGTFAMGLMAKGYFGTDNRRAKQELKQVLQLMSGYNLAQWDTYSANSVAAIKRAWRRLHMLEKIAMLVKHSRSVGVTRKAVLIYLGAA